jgi:phosphoglycerate dehydrogenase-like enzyme
MVKVAVLDDYQRVAAGCADWSSLAADVEFFNRHLGGEEALVDALAGYDVIVAMRERTPFQRSLLERLPDLRLLITTGMRNAAIDISAANELGVTVCGTQSPGHATAELAFGLILALARGITTESESIRSGGWQAGLGRDLRGATLGVVGLGRVGAQVAAFGQAFGMTVIAWSANLTSERAAAVGVGSVSKDDLLAVSDFVSIHVRLSDRTRSLIGAAELAAMKSSAYLVNTSRGPIVDETALLAALRAKQIAGAALDVFDQEPLALDHPFRSEPKLLLTPHIGYVTRETYLIFYGQAVEDIAAWLSGDPVRTLSP